MANLTVLEDDNFFEADMNFQQKQKDIKNTNPFYVSNNNELVADAYKFQRVLGLCLKDSVKLESSFDTKNIYNKNMTEEELNELSKYYTLLPVTIKVINNKLHHQCAIVLSGDNLQRFNSSNILLNILELVIPFLEINENQLRIYSKLYESDIDFERIAMSYTLCQYYNCDTNNYIVLDRLSKMINDSKESSYWSNYYHCQLNITDLFNSRGFQFKEKMGSIQDKDAKEAIDKLMNTGTKTEYDVAENPSNTFKKETFTDASSGLKKKNYKLYKMGITTDRNSEKQIQELFNSITDKKLLFNLYNSLLFSKEYCHVAINNPSILTKMKPFFQNKFMAFYNYAFSYAFTCMYLEECIVKTNTQNSNRYVFNLNTANQLPFFPYCHENIHLNPYCTLLVSDKAVSSNDNCQGLPMITNYNDYGIDSQVGFNNKMNIFTTGLPDKSIFDGLETEPNSKKWKHFAIGGSIIPACAQKRSPLIDQVTTPDMSFGEKYTRFFNEYYSESDIDIMCNSQSVFQYMDNVNNLINVVKKNLASVIGSDSIANTVTVEAHKTLCVLINPKFIEYSLQSFGTVEYVTENLKSPEIKERLYEEYFSVKRESNKKFRKQFSSNNKLYEDFYKIVSLDDMNVMVTSYEPNKDSKPIYDSDTCVYLNDILPEDKQVPSSENIQVMKISENIKFKVRSPHLNHSLEIFRTKYNDYFSSVARFHLSCVRGYFDGETTFLLPSCVSALMTFTNIDYKYFSGSRDPIEIINKYRMRGFGTIVNEVEKSYIVKYNSTVEKWKKLFNFNPNKKNMGSVKLNSDLYKPVKTLGLVTGVPNTYIDLNPSYISTIDEYNDYYKINYGYDSKNSKVDFLKMRGIKSDGNIEQLKKWVLEAAYDELSK